VVVRVAFVVDPETVPVDVVVPVVVLVPVNVVSATDADEVSPVVEADDVVVPDSDDPEDVTTAVTRLPETLVLVPLTMVVREARESVPL
jgi:hypothetical protein